MKQNFKRFLSWTLALLMALSLLPAGLLSVPAYAASEPVTGLNDPEIGLSFNGDSEGNWEADGVSITGSVISTLFLGFIPTPQETTLTITNNKSTAARLMFDYAVDLQGGTVKVADEPVNSGGSYSGELAVGGSITIYLKSGSTSSPTTIRISNILLIASGVRVKTTFSAPEYCSYTVNAGANGTHELSNGSASKEFTQSSTDAYQLKAYPTEGYRFLGWYNLTKEQYISTEAETSMYFDTPCTITARFAAEDAAIFETGGQPFADLGEAIFYASEHGKDKITLIGSGSIYGDYAIPRGITLLIPFDEAGTTYTNVPGYTTTEDTTRIAFRKLTMEKDASITVQGEGAISVGGKHYTSSNAQCCKTTGPYGQIQMEAGSSITLKNGAKLYAWGYITGDGQITANSGAEVYEYFQIMDWRGGNCTKTMAEDAQTVFPFSQYYVQNIEAALTIEAGANEYAYISVTATWVGTQNARIPFVGDKGLFRPLENGRFTKKYISAEDRMSFEIEGPAGLNSIALTVKGVSVDSKDYVLPINNNVDMQILLGTTTVSEDAALLPGVTVSIAKGAELKVAENANLYVYDADQWSKTYVQGSNDLGISPVAYSPSGKGSRTVSDATIDVNGTLTAAGAIYTTEGGANICSSKGTGVYVQQGQPGKSSETYQCIQDDRTPNYTAIPITAAKLHNADGSYTETKNYPQGSEIKYEYNAWGGKPAAITVSFNANGGSGTMSAQSGTAGQNITLPRNCFTYADHTFTGWNTAANGTGTPYDDGATASFAEDTILYAQWTQKPVVTFSANGGDGSMSPQTVEPNAATTLIANTFTRADYDFTGWNTAADGTGTVYADQAAVTLSGNCTLYAQWTLHKYHVRWLNWDRSVLQEGYYTCEDNAAWDDWNNPTPTRPEDENYTYKFSRWVPYSDSINGWGFNPHQDVDFTAQFNQFKKLTVTFDAGDGSGTMDSVKILNGSSGTYYTLPACGFTAPQGQLFDGWLITGTVGYNAFDKYELFDEKWDEDEAELLAFSDLTLKASWTVSKYTITFDTDGGSEIAPITQDYGTAITAPADPIRDGYRFDGWDKEIPGTMPAENVTVKATWTANTYMVSFDANGGSCTTASKSVTYASTYGDLPTPTREGYTFTGWYDGETKVEDTTTYQTAGDKTLTARWSADAYTVTYYVDNSKVAEQGYTYGASITPYVFQKPGYTVSAWKQSDGSALPAAMPAKNLSVYATTAIITYTISYELNGGTNAAGNPASYTVETDTIMLGDPSKTGYTFNGWSGTELNGENNMTVVIAKGSTGDRSYQAHWTISKYTITFDTDGGSEIAPIAQDYGTAITAPTDPIRDGYRFDGWDKEIPATMPAENVTVKAKWTSYLDLINAFANFEGEHLETARGYYLKLSAAQKNADSEKLTALIAAIRTDAETKLKAEIAGKVDAANELLIQDGKSIAKVAITGDQVEVRLIDEDYPALNLVNVSFLTTLFGDHKTMTVKVGSQEATGMNQMAIMVAVANEAGVTSSSAAISALDGKQMPVVLTDTTDGDIQYSVTYQLSFFNNTHTLTWNTNGGQSTTTTGTYGQPIEAPAVSRMGYTFAGWEPQIPEAMGKTALTFTAQWTANTYTITFDANGGSCTTASKSVTYASTYGDLPVPTREGYGFDGWFTAQNDGTKVTGNDTVTITADQTLYAHWKPGAYTITFDTDGGSAIDPITQDYGTKITAPAAPTKTGYTFNGWNPAIPETMPAENMTVKAKWTVNQYTITFDTDGGSGIEPITQNYGTAITAPADPTKVGYTFAGWEPAIPETMLAENRTVKAKWTANQYTITFDTDGGSVLEPITQDYGTAITAPADPTKAGYTFAGWDKEIPATMPAENRTVKAKWTANQYTITFDTDGGSAINSITQDYGTKITAPTAPTKTGYTFNGWNPAIPATMPAENRTVKAKWTANQYTVTFNANGGSACADITVTFGQPYGMLPTPEKAGYTFAGWYAGETPVTAETMVEITANQTLTAHWNAKGNTPYTVEYYQQNLADNDYTKVEEKSLYGQTDSTVVAEIVNYTGFTVNKGKSTTSGTVAGDGGLVLQVYYDRNTYQITWVIDGRETSATYRFGVTPTAPAAEKAADNSGSYTFTGWDKTPATVTEHARYTAQFRKKYDAVIGETTYRTVALALEAAKTGETVTVQDGAAITESTQVPVGVLLLVPCMADDTGYSQRAGSEYYNPNGTAVEPALGANGTRYCTLTEAEGAALTVRGTLLENAETGRPQAGHLDQDINGGYGELQLNGTITVEQGGIFDSCGYTKGNGRITANAGGTVRDLYVVRSWRGGSHAAVMYENKIYPMNEYDMHNITAPIRIYAGAVLEGTVKMYAGGMFSYTRFMQIGESNGLIRLAEGAYADRTYDAKTARVCYTLSGGAAFSSSEMQISGVQVSTGDYYFPVDGDIDLVLEKGAYSINNDLKLLTGSTLTVNGDAALTVKAGAILIAYQQFHDPENTGDTQYPERPAAKILLKNGAVWTVNGGFAGKLTLDETEGSRAVVALAAEAATELSSREANGYQKPRKEPVYQEIKECAVMEENTALTAGMQYSFVRRNGKVCAENRFEAVESSGAFRLLASAADGSRVIAAGYDAQGKMTGVSVLVLSAPSMSGTVTLPKGSWTQLRYFLLSPENAPVCEMCSCAR